MQALNVPVAPRAAVAATQARFLQHALHATIPDAAWASAAQLLAFCTGE